MGSVAEDKQRLRTDVRARLRAVVAEPMERARRSAVLCDRLVAAVGARLAPGDRVMSYDPFPTEPDLGPFADWCVANGMEHHVPHIDGDDLRVGPDDVDPTSLAVVVVPGLAFTADGRRIGRGRGYYDRFLPRLAPGCLRVAVAFREQLVDDVPTEPHDARVELVITDD